MPIIGMFFRFFILIGVIVVIAIMLLLRRGFNKVSGVKGNGKFKGYGGKRADSRGSAGSADDVIEVPIIEIDDLDDK